MNDAEEEPPIPELEELGSPMKDVLPAAVTDPTIGEDILLETNVTDCEATVCPDGSILGNELDVRETPVNDELLDSMIDDDEPLKTGVTDREVTDDAVMPMLLAKDELPVPKGPDDVDDNDELDIVNRGTAVFRAELADILRMLLVVITDIPLENVPVKEDELLIANGGTTSVGVVGDNDEFDTVDGGTAPPEVVLTTEFGAPLPGVAAETLPELVIVDDNDEFAMVNGGIELFEAVLDNTLEVPAPGVVVEMLPEILVIADALDTVSGGAAPLGVVLLSILERELPVVIAERVPEIVVADDDELDSMKGGNALVATIVENEVKGELPDVTADPLLDTVGPSEDDEFEMVDGGTTFVGVEVRGALEVTIPETAPDITDDDCDELGIVDGGPTVLVALELSKAPELSVTVSNIMDTLIELDEDELIRDDTIVPFATGTSVVRVVPVIVDGGIVKVAIIEVTEVILLLLVVTALLILLTPPVLKLEVAVEPTPLKLELDTGKGGADDDGGDRVAEPPLPLVRVAVLEEEETDSKEDDEEALIIGGMIPDVVTRVVGDDDPLLESWNGGSKPDTIDSVLEPLVVGRIPLAEPLKLPDDNGIVVPLLFEVAPALLKMLGDVGAIPCNVDDVAVLNGNGVKAVPMEPLVIVGDNEVNRGLVPLLRDPPGEVTLLVGIVELLGGKGADRLVEAETEFNTDELPEGASPLEPMIDRVEFIGGNGADELPLNALMLSAPAPDTGTVAELTVMLLLTNPVGSIELPGTRDELVIGEGILVAVFDNATEPVVLKLLIAEDKGTVTVPVPVKSDDNPLVGIDEFVNGS
ncbi:hypothetical protein F5Y16DRAFT_416642 [Xylariaceae sp. FL0255]|nr:hypothetical protein F5Y16DRAFT_416642 [Xylariaceae sp. FL0255]